MLELVGVGGGGGGGGGVGAHFLNWPKQGMVFRNRV